MTFQRLSGNVAHLVGGLAEKLFGGGADGNVVALHLNLGHAIHLHRYAFARVNFRRLDINGQQFERQDVHLFKHRHHECAAALHDAEADHGAVLEFALMARDDEHLVGTHFGVAAKHHVSQEEEHHDTDNDGDGADAGLSKIKLGQHGSKGDLHNLE